MIIIGFQNLAEKYPDIALEEHQLLSSYEGNIDNYIDGSYIIKLTPEIKHFLYKNPIIVTLHNWFPYVEIGKSSVIIITFHDDNDLSNMFKIIERKKSEKSA